MKIMIDMPRYLYGFIMQLNSTRDAYNVCQEIVDAIKKGEPVLENHSSEDTFRID